MTLDQITKEDAQRLAIAMCRHFELEFAYMPFWKNMESDIADFIESHLNDMWQADYRKHVYRYTTMPESEVA